MTHKVSRRAFIGGVAGIGAAYASGGDLLALQGKTPLTMFFAGLVFFQHDKTVNEMKVGLLGAGHETIVIARKSDVDKVGTDLNGNQYQSWNPSDLDVVNMSELTYWKGTKASVTLNSVDALSTRPLGVFPLTTLVKPQAPIVTTANCQSVLTFKNGAFSGKRRRSSCGHDSADWSLVTSLADTSPHGKPVKLLDAVQYTTNISAGGFTIENTTVNFTLKSKNVKLWVLQYDSAGTAGKNPREIIHCQHYYDLVPGYQSARYYPRRGDLPAACQHQVDADPIYCTPGE